MMREINKKLIEKHYYKKYIKKVLTIKTNTMLAEEI